jgi:hypothetical protein
MKIRNIALMVVLMLAVTVIFGSVAEAQLYRITQNIFTNKQLINSAGDSVGMTYPIAYNGDTFPGLKGAYPDSIRIDYLASSDTICAVHLFLKIKFAENSGNARVELDSVKSATAVVTTGGTTLTSRTYSGADTFGFAAIASYPGNAKLTTANASKLTVKYTRYFRK